MGTGTAAVYARISRDSEGDALGVARQVEDCRALAERAGLTVREVYSDNDIGASTASRKKARPGYDRLLADARAGHVSVVIAYSNSRLTRRLRELEDLISLHDQYGTRILTVVSGEDNLATADGRMVARIKASVDAAEAERTAERVTRKHLELAQAGRVVGGGHRPFGYEPDQKTIRESEAALIRQAVDDVLAGMPLRRIVLRWNDAGVLTGGGKQWTNGLLLQFLRSPRLAGWRVHRRKGVKWTAVPPVAVGKDGQPVRGEWSPILSDEAHRALVARLASGTDKRSHVPRRNARRYLLTGTLRCGKCNGPMYANKVGDSHYYRCDAPGCSNSASGRGVDAWVAERVVAAAELISATPTGEPSPVAARLDELNRHIGDVNDLITDLMDGFKARHISAAVAFANVTELEERRAVLAAERDAAEADVLATEPSHVDAAAWKAMDTDAKRGVVERWLSAVYVRPATKRGGVFDTSRLDPVWKG